MVSESYSIHEVHTLSLGTTEWLKRTSGTQNSLQAVIFTLICKIRNRNFGWNFWDAGNVVNRIQSIYPVSRGMREWVNKLSGLKRVIFRHIWKVQNEFLQENLDGTFGMMGMLYIGYKGFILCSEGWGNGLINLPGS